MQPIITNNLKAIQDACKMYGVKELYVFGSAVRDDFSDKSDVDFMAEFVTKSNPDDIRMLRAYYDNMDEFQAHLRKIVSREVDLIQEYAIRNGYLRQLINKEKQLIYAEA